MKKLFLAAALLAAFPVFCAEVTEENVPMSVWLYDYDAEEYYQAAQDVVSNVAYNLEAGELTIENFVNSEVPVTFIFNAPLEKDVWADLNVVDPAWAEAPYFYPGNADGDYIDITMTGLDGNPFQLTTACVYGDSWTGIQEFSDEEALENGAPYGVWIYFNGFSAELNDYTDLYMLYFDLGADRSGVKALQALNDAPHYYDLQGRQVNPTTMTHGLYIMRQAGKSVKILK